METHPIKVLHETIERLNDDLTLKEAKMSLLLNEMENINLPVKLLAEQSGYLIEMMEELLEFEKKHPSDLVRERKKRLLNLLHTNTQLNNIVNYNANLKAYNAQLYGELCVLMAKNHLLEKEVQKLNQMNNF